MIAAQLCECGCGTPVGIGARGTQNRWAHGHSHRRPLAERLWAKVDKQPDGCWRWTAHLNHGGYGVIGVGRSTQLAHRVAYELVKGPIPEGFQIDHLCKNTACINPDHLEAVVPLVNTMRSDCPAAVQARQETCANGHPFDVVRPDGRRACSICARERRRLKRLGL